MKKVALINPGRDPSFAIQEPLNLGFLASYLEANGVTVSIIDELAGQDVVQELARFQPDLVGITATTPFAEDAYRVADYCRSQSLRTVMGGVHANVMTEEALGHVDIVVKGEGEYALLKIVGEDIKSGVIQGEYVKNLDEVPRPAYHLMQMEFYMRTKERLPGTYLHFVPSSRRVASMLTSRGCPFNCLFCHNSWRGLPYRFNNAERVLEDIKYLIKEYSIGTIFFIEDHFFVNKPRLKKICEMLIEQKLNIVWGANSRVDNLDEETLRLAKKAGCRQVTFGFESGCQKTLDYYNKRTKVEQNRQAIALCKKVGVLCQGTFIIGGPEETAQDIKETQEFIRQNPIDSAGICIATPFPGTGLWEKCKQEGLIPPRLPWSQFTFDQVPFHICKNLSNEQIWSLYLETCAIADKRKYGNMSTLLRFFMENPTLYIKNILRNPSRAVGLLRGAIFK